MSLFDGEAATTGGHYIVRALAAFYERNKTTSDLREYIKEYISVQVSFHKNNSPPIYHLNSLILIDSIILSLSRPLQVGATSMEYPGQGHQIPRSALMPKLWP